MAQMHLQALPLEIVENVVGQATDLVSRQLYRTITPIIISTPHYGIVKAHMRLD